MRLEDIPLLRPEIDLAPSDWSEHLRCLAMDGVPAGLLAGVDPSDFHILIARLDGAIAATALA